MTRQGALSKRKLFLYGESLGLSKAKVPISRALYPHNLFVYIVKISEKFACEIRVMPERKRSFSLDVFPKTSHR